MQVSIIVQFYRTGVYDLAASSESDVMWYNYILFYSIPSIHCCDDPNKQTRYEMCEV